jgi:hypothetical protein
MKKNMDRLKTYNFFINENSNSDYYIRFVEIKTTKLVDYIDGEFSYPKGKEMIFETSIGKIGYKNDGVLIGYHMIGLGEPTYKNPEYNAINSPAQTNLSSIERAYKLSDLENSPYAYWWKPNTNMRKDGFIDRNQYEILKKIVELANKIGFDNNDNAAVINSTFIKNKINIVQSIDENFIFDKLDYKNIEETQKSKVLEPRIVYSTKRPQPFDLDKAKTEIDMINDSLSRYAKFVNSLLTKHLNNKEYLSDEELADLFFIFKELKKINYTGLEIDVGALVSTLVGTYYLKSKKNNDRKYEEYYQFLRNTGYYNIYYSIYLKEKQK